MGPFDLLDRLFRRPTVATAAPRKLLPETVLFPPPPVSARRAVTVVWRGKVTVDFFRPALITVLMRYPSAVGMFSDELPGMFGDEPDVSCTIGGRPARVVRLLRGQDRLGLEIQLPEGTTVADLSGQTFSLEWTGSRPEVKISVAKRFPVEKA